MSEITSMYSIAVRLAEDSGDGVQHRDDVLRPSNTGTEA